jgi:hypothetical protein
VDPVRDLLQRLKETQGDTHAQSALTAEFLLINRPDSEALSAAVDAAAILHWFDSNLLQKMLEVSAEDGRHRFEALREHSFVERYHK